MNALSGLVELILLPLLGLKHFQLHELIFKISLGCCFTSNANCNFSHNSHLISFVDCGFLFSSTLSVKLSCGRDFPILISFILVFVDSGSDCLLQCFFFCFDSSVQVNLSCFKCQNWSIETFGFTLKHENFWFRLNKIKALYFG